MGLGRDLEMISERKSFNGTAAKASQPSAGGGRAVVSSPQHIKGCSNPKASPGGLNGAASLSSNSVMESKSSLCRRALELHPSPLTGLCGRAGSPQGKQKTHTEVHVGCPDRSVGGWGTSAARRSNISTVNVWKTGGERTHPQRDPGIL